MFLILNKLKRIGHISKIPVLDLSVDNTGKWTLLWKIQISQSWCKQCQSYLCEVFTPSDVV